MYQLLLEEGFGLNITKVRAEVALGAIGAPILQNRGQGSVTR